METQIKIRLAAPSDAQQIGQLIFDTIRTINRKDYNEIQVNTWAPDPIIYSTYEDSFAYVADLERQMIGFANLTSEGYLHKKLD